MDIKLLTDIFYQSLGSFAIVEFKSGNGSTIVARGVLRNIDRELGDVLIVHRDIPGKVWGFNVSCVSSYHFEPLKDTNNTGETEDGP